MKFKLFILVLSLSVISLRAHTAEKKTSGGHLEAALKNLESEIDIQEAKLKALKASYAELKSLAGQSDTSAVTAQPKSPKAETVEESADESTDESVKQEKTVGKKPKRDWENKLPVDNHY